MKYFDEMATREGFSGGTAVPQEAFLCRVVYVQVLNKLLEKHGSNCRIVVYDAATSHNSMNWLRISKEVYATLLPHHILDGEISSFYSPINAEPEADDAWEAAVEEAENMGLDDYVVTEPKIDSHALKQLLKEIKVPNKALANIMP